MAYGVLSTGFKAKRLADIKTELQSDLESVFGTGIDFDERQPFGQLIGIFAERESLLWELFEQVYNAAYVRTAEDTALEKLAAFSGIAKDHGTYSTGTVKAYGTLGTVIPKDSIISVDGNADARFKTDAAATIAAGTNEQQTISFSATPDAGAFTLVYDGEATASIAYTDNAAAVESALEALSGITSVTVTGSFAAGFVVEWDGADAETAFDLLTVGTSTLTNGGSAVTTTITETQAGEAPHVEIDVTAEERGATVALTGTLTEIETPVSGWDSVTNESDITVGTDAEEDAELKLRREEQIANAAAATCEAIKAALSDVENVTQVVVYKNNTYSTDGDGRPPKSVEAVVRGGTDADIAEALFDVIGGGIASHGGTSETIQDSDGKNQIMRFSRPTEIDVHLEIDITALTDEYPSGGDSTLETAILDYADDLTMGDDVVVYPTLMAILDHDDVPGITDVVIRIGTSASPTLDNNISISADEIAIFDSARITINTTLV